MRETHLTMLPDDTWVVRIYTTDSPEPFTLYFSTLSLAINYLTDIIDI